LQHDDWSPPAAATWIAEVAAKDRGFFRGLPEEPLRTLHATARGIAVPEGRLLWEQGSHDGLFCWIASGRVRVERDDAVIAIMEAGDVLGLSSIHGRPHTARVRAIDDATLLVWQGTTVRDTLEASPRALIAALGTVTELVGSLNAELVLLRSRARATQLVAWHLLRMERSARAGLDLTREQLASRIGIAPRALHEALGALAREGIVRLEPLPSHEEEAIVLADPDRARAVVAGTLMIDV
jgi:CRP-like cAMP-binding protein